jgi:anti-sigma factor RsiW
MITCQELINYLIDYVSDDLTPEQKAHIDHHLEFCPPCVTYIDTYKTTIRLTRALPMKPVPPELIARLKQAMESDYGRSSPSAGA